MLRDKTHGAIPLGAADLPPSELAPLIVGLQIERVELNEMIDALRFRRDELAGQLATAKRLGEGQALKVLPPGRGKTEPSSSAIKSFVDAFPAVLDIKALQVESSRDLATADDRLGAVRSGIRVLLSLVEIQRDAEARRAEPDAPAEDW